MKYIRVSLTSACNMRCIYCHNEGNTTFSVLSVDDVLKFAATAKEMGLTQFRLTGGDPTCHPNFSEICEKLVKMGITVGVNTNGALVDQVLPLIEKGCFSHVTVGIDYYNAAVSKMSPVGLSSKEILDNVLKMKAAGCKNVSVDCVYTNNYTNVTKMVDWCLKNKILLKIIERNEKNANQANQKLYNQMVKDVAAKFNLKLKRDRDFKDYYGYLNDELVIKFYRSHCNKKECKLCYSMHLRLSSDYKLKYCLFESEQDIDCRVGDLKENLRKALNREMPTRKEEF